MSIPIRPHGSHHYDRPASPLAHSWDSRGETFVTHAPIKRDHKRIYSVDDNRSTKLIAEIEPHRPHGSSSRSGAHYRYAKPLIRTTDLNDDDYSYTDPAAMYKETEPIWRRPRSGSVERGSRPSSLYIERGPRSSTREPGPPPTTRGLDKVNSALARNGSVRDPARTSSWDRAGDSSKYREEYYAAPSRSGSTRHPTTTVHQEHHDRRRDTYSDDRERRDREAEHHHHQTPSDRYEDHDVASRGFGIRTGESKHTSRDESLDRQPIWSPHETSRARSDEYGGGFYPSDDPRRAPDTRMPEPHIPRDREPARYDDRPRDNSHRHERDHEDRGYTPAVAPVAGAAAAYGAAEAVKARDRDRVAEKDRERAREERYEEDDRRSRRHRVPSSDGSSDDRPRHYVDRDAARDVDSRRKDSARKAEPPVDPDEEYRRRIMQEQERSLRSNTRERDHSDSDKDRDSRRRKDERDRDREDSAERRQRGSPSSTAAEPAHSRYAERSTSVLDKDIVQEPDSLTPTDTRNMQIVAPPKDPAPQPKGILRKPTEKFPEDPEPIREGVAPHKSALKGKDIPPNARWTKIDRRLVNPEALEEAKERFEERMDCVIVLRVLTKQEIQKLADRTREIREARGLYTIA
jgi:zinc finger CCCH domain-containing protein 13